MKHWCMVIKSNYIGISNESKSTQYTVTSHIIQDYKQMLCYSRFFVSFSSSSGRRHGEAGSVLTNDDFGDITASNLSSDNFVCQTVANLFGD